MTSMKRIGLNLRPAFLLAALLFASLCSAAAVRPNIIVVLADDLGWGDVSAYGGKVPTPYLDRMIREGTRFTQFYVASPICSPSRAGLLTGQFPARWNITSYLQTRAGNRACEQADFLSTNAPSLPRQLRAAGYATAHIGKWHLGGGRDVTNAPKFAAYGYDLGYGTYESPEPHPDLTATNWIWSPRDKVKRWERTRWMVDQTLDFLQAHPSQPCFVNLWLDDVHTPWIPTQTVQDDKAQRGDTRKNLRPVLIETDRQIGRLLAQLRERGLASNTLVLFLGDNGPLPTFNQDRTAGLRGSKLSLYEGGTREPLIAWWPGRVPPGRIDSNTVFSAVDIFPTLVTIGEATPPERAKLDGWDCSGALFGTERARTTALFWEYGRNPTSFNFPGNANNRSPNLAVRIGDWKLLVNGDGSGAELFNLTSDPRETRNVAGNFPDRTADMVREVRQWRDSVPALP